jgi:hypothetical protein
MVDYITRIYRIGKKISASYPSAHGIQYKMGASPLHPHQHYSTQKCNQTHHPGAALVVEMVTDAVEVRLASTTSGLMDRPSVVRLANCALPFS